MLRVKIGEANSNCINVTSGVPQGSALTPVLFCLNGLSCDADMFADDMKIGGQLRVHLMFKVYKMILTICQAGPSGAS